MVFDGEIGMDRHALARLERDMIGWLTTVTPDGQPQTFPIWFLWDAGEVLVYSDRRAKRNLNIASNPRVSLHLDDDGAGRRCRGRRGRGADRRDGAAARGQRGLQPQVRRAGSATSSSTRRGVHVGVQRPAPDPPDRAARVRRMSRRRRTAVIAARRGVRRRGRGPARARRGWSLGSRSG